MKMTPEDIRRLKYAKDLLENPGLAAKLTNIIGIPFEKAFEYLPAKWTGTIQTITQKSLRHALALCANVSETLSTLEFIV